MRICTKHVILPSGIFAQLSILDLPDGHIEPYSDRRIWVMTGDNNKVCHTKESDKRGPHLLVS
jgi:hypothetical protein